MSGKIAIALASIMGLIAVAGCSVGQFFAVTGAIGGNLELGQIIANGLGFTVPPV